MLTNSKRSPDASTYISSIQRTGFIFDRILRKAKLSEVIEKVLKKKVKAIIPLVASGRRTAVKIDHKWNVFINEKIEPDV